jgi:hypothetical protein
LKEQGLQANEGEEFSIKAKEVMEYLAVKSQTKEGESSLI